MMAKVKECNLKPDAKSFNTYYMASGDKNITALKLRSVYASGNKVGGPGATTQSDADVESILSHDAKEHSESGKINPNASVL